MKKSTKTFVLSDESLNLYAFKVLTAGIDLDSFKANPIMLYDHDYTKPIGQWTDLQIQGTQLTGVPMFDEEDPEAMKFCSKVEQGILKGASIGISPIQFNEATGEMEKCSIKETSITPVPANKNAIALYNSKGQKLNGEEAKQYLLSLRSTEAAPKTEKQTNMYQKTIPALVALCLQAGHTVNLSAQSTDDEVEAVVKKVGDKITELTGKVLTLETQAKTAKEKEVEDLVDAAIAEKRLSASDKQAFVDFGKMNLTALKTTLIALKAPEVKATITAPAGGAGAPGAGAPAADDKAAWTFDDFALKAPAELELMQGADPTRFQKLLSAKTASVRAIAQIGDKVSA